jgi:WD40 repeat protein
MLCIRFYNWRTGKQTNTITTTKFTQDYSNLIPLSKNILIAVEKQSDQIVLLDREKKGGKTLKFPTESIKNTPLISLLSCGFLAVAAEDNIYIFNVRTGKVVKHFKAPSPITCITSFENGRFATGAKDFDVHIWG